MNAEQIALLVFMFMIAVIAIVVIDWRSHFYAYPQCQKVIGLDGVERDSWSFSSWHSYTLIGRIIGKPYIAFQAARFTRKARKLQKQDI